MLALLVIVSLWTPYEGVLSGRAVVVDGDTIRLNRNSIRLEGIDAPERRQYCENPSGRYACGSKATNHLRKLINSRAVTCRGWKYDVYNRLLAICHRSNQSDNVLSLNARMVFDGWAVSFYDFPKEEKAAESAARGLWSGKFVYPADWRAEQKKIAGDALDISRSLWNWFANIAERWLY